MRKDYSEDFKNLLENNGYNGQYEVEYDTQIKNGIFTSFNIKGKEEIKGKYIQSFILMSPTKRMRSSKYPIWGLYHQTVGKYTNNEVNPAVFIASRDSRGIWHIFSAGDTKREKDRALIVDYKWAYDRYKARYEGVIKLDRNLGALRWTSWILASLVSVYLFLHIVTNMSEGFNLPLTSQIVLLGSLIVLLILFPLVFPFINAISIKGIDLSIRDE